MNGEKYDIDTILLDSEIPEGSEEEKIPEMDEANTDSGVIKSAHSQVSEKVEEARYRDPLDLTNSQEEEIKLMLQEMEGGN